MLSRVFRRRPTRRLSWEDDTKVPEQVVQELRSFENVDEEELRPPSGTPKTLEGPGAEAAEPLETEGEEEFDGRVLGLTPHNPFRKWLLNVVKNPLFDAVILVCILLNSVCMGLADFRCIDRDTGIIDTEPSLGAAGTPLFVSDCRGNSVERNEIFLAMERPFNVLFIIEMAMRLLALGPRAYFRDRWNWVDAVVTVVGAVSLGETSEAASLDAIRVVRALRPLRSLSKIQKLQVLVLSVLNAIPQLISVLAVLAFLYSVFAIVGLQLYMGRFHARCRITPYPVTLGWTPDRDAAAFRCLDAPTLSQGNGDFPGKEDSPWYEDQECFWPVDEADERNCVLSDTLDFNKGYRCDFVEAAVEYEDAVYNLSRVCGSNYDAYGNPRFSGGFVALENRTLSTEELMRKPIYLSSKNYGYTVFDNIFTAYITIIQVNSLEGWAEIMSNAMDVGSPVISGIFFVLLVVCGAFIVLNLVLAVLEASFSAQKKILKDEKRRKRALAEQRRRDKHAVVTSPVTLHESLHSMVRGVKTLSRSYTTSSRRIGAIMAEAEQDGAGPTPGHHRFRSARGTAGESKEPGNSVRHTFAGKSLSEALGSPVSAAPSTPTPIRRGRSHDGSEGPEVMERAGSFFSPRWTMAEYDQEEELSRLRRFFQNPRVHSVLLGVVVLNTIVLALDRHPIDDMESNVYQGAGAIFTIIFAVELLLKIIAFNPYGFIAHDDAGAWWAIADALITVLSVIQLALYPPYIFGGARDTSTSSVSALRVFRAFRLFRLVPQLGKLQVLLEKMFKAFIRVSTIVVLLGLIVYIYALLGMNVFANRLRFDPVSNFPLGLENPGWDDADVPRSHFDTLDQSFVTLFVVLTGEDWNDVMYDCWRAAGAAAPIYFLTFIVFGKLFVVNLLVAVLISTFDNGLPGPNSRRLVAQADMKSRQENSRTLDALDLPRINRQRRGSGSSLRSHRGLFALGKDDQSSSRSVASEYQQLSSPASMARHASLDAEAKNPGNTDDGSARGFSRRNSGGSAGSGTSIPSSAPILQSSWSGQEGEAFVGYHRYSDGNGRPDAPSRLSSINESKPLDVEAERREQDARRKLSDAITPTMTDAAKESAAVVAGVLSGSGRSLRSLPREADPPAASYAPSSPTAPEVPSAPPAPGSPRSPRKSWLQSMRPSIPHLGGGRSPRAAKPRSPRLTENAVRLHDVLYSDTASGPREPAAVASPVSASTPDPQFSVDRFFGADKQRSSSNPLNRASNSSLRSGFFRMLVSAPDEGSRMSLVSDTASVCCAQLSLWVANLRNLCSGIVSSPWFSRASLVVILLSCVILVLDTPLSNPEAPSSRILAVLDHLATFLFALEAVIKILAMGFFCPRNPISEAESFDATVHSYWVHTKAFFLRRPRPAGVSPSLGKPRFSPALVSRRSSEVMSRSDMTARDSLLSMGRESVYGSSVRRWNLGNDGSGRVAYLQDGWNKLDLAIALISILSSSLALVGVGSNTNLEGLKALRAGRALRPLALVKTHPQLRLVVAALFASAGDVLNLSFIIVLVFGIFAILFTSELKGQLRSCQGPVYEASIMGTLFQDLLEEPKPFSSFTAVETDTFEDATFFDATSAACAAAFGGGGGTGREVCDCFGAHWADVVPQSFDNVGVSLLTLLEMCTTEGWADVMYAAADARGIDMQPIRNANWSSGMPALFIIFMLIGSFFAVNAFIGVVYDNFVRKKRNAEREGYPTLVTEEQQRWIEIATIGAQWRPKLAERKSTTNGYWNQLRHPSERRSSRLSWSDILEATAPGITSNGRWSRSGSSEFDFLEVRGTLSPPDWGTRIQMGMYSFRQYCLQLSHTQPFKHLILAVIILNSIVLAMQYFGQGTTYGTTLEILNLCFLCIFVLEAIIKVTGSGFRGYFSDGWNRFDFFLVVVGVANTATILATASGDFRAAQQAGASTSFATALRVFRVGRTLRMIKAAGSIRQMFGTIVRTVPALLNVGGLLLLLLFVFAVVGNQMFAKVAFYGLHSARLNFRDVHTGMLTLFRFTTGENWNGFMHDLTVRQPDCDPDPQYNSGVCYFEGFYFKEENGCVPLDGCGSNYIFPFMLLYIIAAIVIVNLLIGAVLQSFDEARRSNEEVERALRDGEMYQFNFKEFQEAWALYDPAATSYITIVQLRDLLQNLKEPWGFGTRHLATERELNRKMRTLNLKVYDGTTVHFVDVLVALSMNHLSEEAANNNKSGFKAAEDLPAVRDLYRNVDEIVLATRNGRQALRDCDGQPFRIAQVLAMEVIVRSKWYQRHVKNDRALRPQGRRPSRSFQWNPNVPDHRETEAALRVLRESSGSSIGTGASFSRLSGKRPTFASGDDLQRAKLDAKRMSWRRQVSKSRSSSGEKKHEEPRDTDPFAPAQSPGSLSWDASTSGFDDEDGPAGRV